MVFRRGVLKYAIAQSASMEGTATGVVPTVGGMTVGTLVVSVAVPVIAVWRRLCHTSIF